MTHLKLFNSSFITRGHLRSLMIDVERGKMEFIPNEMEQVIKYLVKGNSIKKVKEQYGKENENIIDEYICFLIENEYAFYIIESELDFFPDMETVFHNPRKITNAIVEIGQNHNDLSQIINQLEELGCHGIYLIAFETIEPNKLFGIMDYFRGSNFDSIELTIKYREDYSMPFLEELSHKYFRITNLTLSEAKKDAYLAENKKLLFNLTFTKTIVSSFKSCGKVDSKYFNINKKKILESYNKNSCLNCKISITSSGEIMNCPSMIQSFGNIKDTTLQEAVAHKDFKKYWNITKDQIDVCMDCEFRHICTDCRAYTEDANSDYSKPLKCGYNPYTNKWEEWSTNPLKQKAIEYYGMQELVKKDA